MSGKQTPVERTNASREAWPPYTKRGVMKSWPIQLEISGPSAMWTRPDTGSAPVSYVAPTYSAVKGIIEAVLRWKSVNIRPVKCVK